MTVNVTEGGLTLRRGSASAIKVGTLTAAKGTTVQLDAEVGNSEALTVKNGLDLTGATLDLSFNGTIADYADSSIFTVEAGDVSLNNATVKLSNLVAPTSSANLGDSLSLTIVKHTGMNATSDTADATDGADDTGDVDLDTDATGADSQGTAPTQGVRAAVRRAVVLADSADTTTDATSSSSTPTLSADGATVDIDSDFYKFYFQDFALQTTDDTIVLTANARQDNPFDEAASSANSTAGANMLWDTRADAPEGTVLGDAREAVRAALQSGDTKGAARSMAAIAGSTVNALGTAQRDALRDQMGRVKSRVLATDWNTDLGHHFWIEGTGAYTNVHTQSDKGGYKLSTWGGTVGADTQVTKALSVGAALTADYGDLRSVAAERATGDLDSIYVNLFGHYQSKAWGHTLVLTGANNDAKLDRTVDYGTGSYQTHGKTHGYGLGALYELTYDVALNDKGTSLLQPLFDASIVSTTMKEYDETGAGNANLHVADQEWTTATLALGARWSGSFGAATVGRTINGELRTALAQDFGDKQGKTAVSFAGLSNAAQNVYGAKVGATAWQISGGLSTNVSQNGTVYANAGAEIRNGANSVNGTVGFRYAF
jgi:uncharacterized protein with beta-barrel porin domain